jgi:predicted secreted protein
MKVKVSVLAAGIMVLLAAVGCSQSAGVSAADQVDVDVPIDAFMASPHITRDMVVPHRGVLTIALGANASTGFSWSEDATIAGPAILRQTETEYLSPEGEAVVGASGAQVWTFEAVEKGTTSLLMEYGRPWEGGEKGVWTFELTVTVS